MELSLSVVATDGMVRHRSLGTDEVTLGWRGCYEPGDRLLVTCDADVAHLVVRLDACLAESRVLVRGGSFWFAVPLGEAQKAYGAGWAFEGERHLARVRTEDPREAGAWQNLALNACDQRDGGAVPGVSGVALYPHASTNVCCDNPQFWARNALDGVVAPELHGSWPHESWGINGTRDAWLKVDFGEPVVADELRLYLRADFPHDTCWERARVVLSDGSELSLALRKTDARQSFSLGGRTVEWLRLCDLVKRDEPGFPGLSQLEVWGRRA